MAEVATYSESIGNMASTMPLPRSSPDMHVAPTSDFSLPSARALQTLNFSTSHRRGKSMNNRTSDARSAPRTIFHQRGASAMPDFSFNATDMSGRTIDEPESAPAPTPSRSTGHMRQTSTYVGGVGIVDAISSSPTKTNALPTPPRAAGHGRMNSRVTLSGQDWSQIMMRADEQQPRLSTSLPNTPLDYPSLSWNDGDQYALSNGKGLPRMPSDDSTHGSDRPPSRPRVEFSDNVEYIPRPLSTVSSETSSSMSTVRGHSVNNSISSVLSMTAPSPPSSRARATSLETTPEDEPKKAPRSSIELSNKRVEREGQWLKHGSSRDSLKRPTTELVGSSPRLTFSIVEATKKPGPSHKRRQSIGHALGFDRRKSEPAFGNHTDAPSRFSAISLQEPGADSADLDTDGNIASDSRSSSQRLKDWARSKVSRKARLGSVYLAMPEPQASDASPVSEPAIAETDLDTVFSLDSDELPAGSVYARPTVPAVDPSVRHTWSSSRGLDKDDMAPMLDLDAALGPFNTLGTMGHKSKRELHSRRTRDFGGAGGYYQPSLHHRRTESAPMLTPWEYRMSTPPQPCMDDVFEEDEEQDDVVVRNMRTNSNISVDEETGTGVEIVDSNSQVDSSVSNLSLEDGLRIQNSQWESERPSTSYSNMSSRLSAAMFDRRSSVIEDTIVEEASPTEPAIAKVDQEPRAQSLTKSSDFSDTPTILAAQTGLLALPDGQPMMTPETYNSSVFSSPDLGRRHNSFETSRVGTSASSVTDNRTISSCTTGEGMHDVRISVDDVPSLTSSRSTMMSTLHANSSRRDVGGARTPSVNSSSIEGIADEQRRKRSSIQSLSQLMSGSFGPRHGRTDSARPQTATDVLTSQAPKKKEHNRLKKLMFWKSKHRQGSSSTMSQGERDA